MMGYTKKDKRTTNFGSKSLKIKDVLIVVVLLIITILVIANYTN
jgi:hypothetical protein